MALKNFLLAGFGGQGILFSGKVIAYSGLMDGKRSPGFPRMARKCAAAQQTAASVSPTNPSVPRWSCLRMF